MTLTQKRLLILPAVLTAGALLGRLAARAVLNLLLGGESGAAPDCAVRTIGGGFLR